MNTKIIKYLILFITVLTISCDNEKYNFYEGEAYIQFGPEPYRIYNGGYDYRDTVKTFSFAYSNESVKQDTIFFDIYAIGGIKPYDRVFKLEQMMIKESENAISEVHYKSFESSELASHYVIQKDSIHARVPIVMLRDESLKEKEFTLQFQVVSNKEFKTAETRLLWRRLIFADKMVKPNKWDQLERYYLGKYSVTKHKWMIEITKEKWDNEFVDELNSSITMSSFWNNFLKFELIKLNKEREEMLLDKFKDEDNEYIVFP